MTVTIDDSERGSGGGNGDAPDLISRYQDHVSRKITSARETREIYDRLLSRVASGELDPRALDRELNSFLQTRQVLPQGGNGVAHHHGGLAAPVRTRTEAGASTPTASLDCSDRKQPGRR